MKYLLISLKSWYSFRNGVDSPASLAAALAEKGFQGGVLADRDVVTGQLEFAAVCNKAGIKGIHGVELVIHEMKLTFMILPGGWPDLCRLVTSVHTPGRISLMEAFVDSQGLIAITENPADAKKLRETDGFQGSIMVAVFPECISGRNPAEAEREILQTGFDPVASWPVMFSSKERLEPHEVLRRGYLAIEKTRSDPSEFSTERNVMPDIGRFRESFRGASRSLIGNAKLAEMSGMEMLTGRKERPRNPEEEKELSEVIHVRLKDMYKESLTAARRTERELSIICENGLAGYFLRFFEVASYARRKGVAISSRGSAGGSILSYLLGLSIVCPIRHDLSFARFFNRLRSSPPDIDLDIDSARRDEVMKWFLKKAGRKGAAVSQIVTHRMRSAFRVAASGLGVSSKEMDTLSKLLRYRDNAAWRKPVAARALRDGEMILGIPSHLAPHPCGVVCADDFVDLMVPVQHSPNGLHITHFDKDGIEDIGLLKMDLLGQRGLTTISGICKILDKNPLSVFRRGGRIPEAARELLDSGRTIGVVHVESPAMRGLMKEMKIRSMEDVARVLALVRPGASAGGGRKTYLDCLSAGSAVNSMLPELRPILLENLGVMLYQEDVSKAAEVLLGLDEASADLLRRRLKKEQVKKEEVISFCRRRNINPLRADAVWNVLSSYAGYGFCKAHAFTYGAIACAAAVLKTEYPALYMASVMAAGGGFYCARVYLEEARRLGINFEPPGVNTGRWLSFERGGKIIPGFHHIKSMGSREYEKLRESRPYRYPSDLLKAGCGLELCRYMAAAGCFRELGFSRSSAMMQLEAGDSGFFPGMPVGAPDLPDYSIRTRVSMELGIMGLPLAASPLELTTRPGGTVPLADMPSSGMTRIWGRYVTGRRLAADAGFLMLEDNTGVADAFLPSPLFRRAEDILVRPEATIIVRGKVENGGRLKAFAADPGPLSIKPLEPEPPGK